jgi:hypothetical protein
MGRCIVYKSARPQREKPAGRADANDLQLLAASTHLALDNTAPLPDINVVAEFVHDIHSVTQPYMDDLISWSDVENHSHLG